MIEFTMQTLIAHMPIGSERIVGIVVYRDDIIVASESKIYRLVISEIEPGASLNPIPLEER